MPSVQTCIELCQRCHDTCLTELTQHCLKAGGAHVEPQHVVLMMDCIAICQAAADFMHRGSAHHAAVCEACAEVCEACAESCANLDGMDACARICDECAEACLEMVEA